MHLMLRSVKPAVALPMRDSVYISFLALFKIIDRLSTKENPLLATSFDSEIYLHISKGKYSGWCVYDTDTQIAHNFNNFWNMCVQEAKAEAQDIMEEKNKIAKVRNVYEVL